MLRTMAQPDGGGKTVGPDRRVEEDEMGCSRAAADPPGVERRALERSGRGPGEDADDQLGRRAGQDPTQKPPSRPPAFGQRVPRHAEQEGESGQRKIEVKAGRKDWQVGEESDDEPRQEERRDPEAGGADQRTEENHGRGRDEREPARRLTDRGERRDVGQREREEPGDEIEPGLRREPDDVPGRGERIQVRTGWRRDLENRESKPEIDKGGGEEHRRGPG